MINDYLKTYEKFKDTKEVVEYIDNVLLLRHYYTSQQFSKMQEHIQEVMNKYVIETLVWNAVNHYQPTTFEQLYINAECFLQKIGAKIIVELVRDYARRLTEEEVVFIESMVNEVR